MTEDQKKVDKRLCEVFSDAHKLYETFEQRDDPTNSGEFQVIIVFKNFGVFIFVMIS